MVNYEFSLDSSLKCIISERVLSMCFDEIVSELEKLSDLWLEVDLLLQDVLEGRVEKRFQGFRLQAVVYSGSVLGEIEIRLKVVKNLIGGLPDDFSLVDEKTVVKVDRLLVWVYSIIERVETIRERVLTVDLSRSVDEREIYKKSELLFREFILDIELLYNRFEGYNGLGLGVEFDMSKWPVDYFVE